MSRVSELCNILNGRKFKPGDAIVTASPFAHVVAMRYNGQFCDWCCFPAPENDRLLKCSSCKYEHYCNKICQKKAWQYHKFECPLIKKRYPRIASDSSRLLTKIVWNLSQGVRRPENDPGWRDFSNLCDNLPEMKDNPTRMNQYYELKVTLSNYLGEKLYDMIGDPGNLLSIFGKMVFNGFTLTYLDKHMGAAVYISPSIFDHSCMPNAVFVNNGVTVTVRAIKDIDTSKEEVLVNYIETIQPTRLRKDSLLRDYTFDCICPKCSNITIQSLADEAVICPFPNCKGIVYKLEEGLKCQKCSKFVDDPAYLAQINKAEEEAISINDGVHERTNNMDIIKSFLKRNEVLAQTHVLLAALKINLYADESQFGDTQTAYNLGEKISDIFRYHYPEYFPPHGEHQFKQARLAWQLDQYDKALNHYKEALRHLSVTHGPDHHYTKLVQSDMEECSRDRSIYNMSVSHMGSDY